MPHGVLYAEVPCFYAEVERALDPALAERPVIVGGDPRGRGVVAEATADARAAGVALGMTMQEALQRCPRARALRTNMARYREASQRLRACLRRVAGRLEPDGLAAAYLDAGGLAEAADATAERLCAAVRQEMRLPLRIGIASNKLLARLAAEEAGPGGTRELRPGEEERFLHALPVSRLPGVGPQTETRLRELGARTVGELAALGRGVLEAALGNRGLELLALARGHGSAEIRAGRFPGSLSQETTLETPETDLAVLGGRLVDLARKLEGTLRLEGLAARRVALKVRYLDGETVTRTETQPRGVADADALEAITGGLLRRTDAGRRPVRLLGIALAGFQPARPEDRQLELFPR